MFWMFYFIANYVEIQVRRFSTPSLNAWANLTVNNRYELIVCSKFN